MEKVMAGVKTYIKAEDKMFYKYQYHTNIPDSTPTRSPSSPLALWAILACSTSEALGFKSFHDYFVTKQQERILGVGIETNI